MTDEQEFQMDQATDVVEEQGCMCPCHKREQAARIDCGHKNCNYYLAKPASGQTELNSQQLARIEALKAARDVLQNVQLFGKSVPQGPDALIKVAQYVEGATNVYAVISTGQGEDVDDDESE